MHVTCFNLHIASAMAPVFLCIILTDSQYHHQFLIVQHLGTQTVFFQLSVGTQVQG